MKWKSTSCHTFKGIKIISLNFCKAYVIMTVIIKNTVLTHLPCVPILSHWMLVTTLWSWYSHPHIAERILTIRDISYMPSVQPGVATKVPWSSTRARRRCGVPARLSGAVAVRAGDLPDSPWRRQACRGRTPGRAGCTKGALRPQAWAEGQWAVVSRDICLYFLDKWWYSEIFYLLIVHLDILSMKCLFKLSVSFSM